MRLDLRSSRSEKSNVTSTESRHSSTFILYEGSGWFSRESIAVAPNQTLAAGQVVGKIAREGGSDEVAALNPKGTDGSEIAAGVVVYAVTTDDSTPKKAAVLVSRAEVRGSDLIWPTGITPVQQAAAVEQLRAAGILVS
jgi:Bacteriophage lambda head decoration protein D